LVTSQTLLEGGEIVGAVVVFRDVTERRRLQTERERAFEEISQLKEQLARAIHDQSQRSEAPLVKVNCASIPSELFESELFGHVKGAFTGAHQDRIGRLQLADGGTLFLDEIGEIPLSHQGKLLILSSGKRLRLDLVLGPQTSSAAQTPDSEAGEFMTEEEFRAFETSNLRAALVAADWRVSGSGGAAELLGLKPSTVVYRMKRLGLEMKQEQGG
jgi:transcriptional regulator with GAF, ATPase, and Fis domain